MVVLGDGRLVRYLRGDPERGHAASDAEVSIGPASVAALTTEGSTMVVALPDGTVSELDPESFALDRIAAVDGEPLWIAPCAHFSFVVVTRRHAPPSYGVSIISRDSHHVRSFVAPEAGIPPRTPPALAVDDDTLWLASPNQLLRIGLDTEHVTTLAMDLDTVCGVLVRRKWGGYDANGFRTKLPSTVLAYGGTAGGSAVIDVSGEPRTIWRNDQPRRGPIHPVRSLTPNGTAFVAIAGATYYGVDAELATWTAMATLPDEVVPDAAAGKFHSSGGKIMFATAHDGLFVLSGHAADTLLVVVPLASVRTFW